MRKDTRAKILSPAALAVGIALALTGGTLPAKAALIVSAVTCAPSLIQSES
jgi:hypothetical protein